MDYPSSRKARVHVHERAKNEQLRSDSVLISKGCYCDKVKGHPRQLITIRTMASLQTERSIGRVARADAVHCNWSTSNGIEGERRSRHIGNELLLCPLQTARRPLFLWISSQSFALIVNTADKLPFNLLSQLAEKEFQRLPRDSSQECSKQPHNCNSISLCASSPSLKNLYSALYNCKI